MRRERERGEREIERREREREREREERERMKIGKESIMCGTTAKIFSLARVNLPLE